MIMVTFFQNFFKLPCLKKFPLKNSNVSFSLNRLTRGVDNIRYDVRLSPDFCKAVSKIVVQVIAAHTQSEEIPNLDRASSLSRERDEFKRLCCEIMTNAVNKAKLRRDIQIDYLLQTAIVKVLLEEIRSQYEKLVMHIKNVIRENEISRNQEGVIQFKKELSDIMENRKAILHKVGSELFQYLIEVQNEKLKEMRESNFGDKAVLPDHIFSNPILHAEDLSDGFFMLNEYDILLGRRVEDPDRYDTLVSFIRDILIQIDEKNAPKQHAEENVSLENGEDVAEHQETDAWMSHTDNVCILLDCFESGEQCRRLKKQKGDKGKISVIRNRAKDQRKLLSFFYRKFRKKKLTERIVAVYEMQSVYLQYCPPLVPQLVLQYLLVPKSRKTIANRLKKLKLYYGKSFSLRPLRKLIMKLDQVSTKARKAYLIRFLNGFVRYHRDFQNFKMLKEAMDSVNLATKEKILDLSRANNTLYEFLLSHETDAEEKPVISHAIIKADVRGSTDIVHKMKERGLNPATYFSLNFFDPITDILSEYEANKVCIEGDAYILSIYERENTPEGWYSVARACGLAISMLSIIRRCNAKNKKHQLPMLELGIGITYRSNAPTIFFDGDSQIMISSAINLADRLSGCSKSVRKKMAGNKEPFNLYVFQTESDTDVAATADDLSLRYNVNGIELNDFAFKKLSEEIDLRVVKANIQKKRQTFYIGKFPTVTGIYQTLIIREDHIPKVDPDSLDVIDSSCRKYYEVCANPKLCEYVKKIKPPVIRS